MSKLKGLNLNIGRQGLTKSTSDTNPIQEISTDEMTRTIRLSEIANYERNPRIIGNAVYEQIKDSLRASGGFKGTLEATVPPDSGTGFITYRGGGTRLLALKELYGETSDPAFDRLKIVVLPYPGDAQLIANHLAENENRGDLIFIERALGVIDLKRALDADSDTPLTDAAFARRATEMGYKVIRTRMPAYRFAAETLHPVLPQALQSMGRPQVEFLHALRKSLDEFALNNGNAELAENVWLIALTGLDKPDLTPERIRSSLADSLAEHNNMDPGDAFGVLNPDQKTGVPMVHPGDSDSRTSASPVPKNSILKPFPAPLADCIEFADDLSTFNVSAPAQPLDTTAKDYAASCVAWHLLQRLDPTCRPRRETIDTRVGPLTAEILAKLDNDELSRILNGFTSLHRRLKKRDADKPDS